MTTLSTAPDTTTASAPATVSRGRLVLRRFLRKRLALAGLAVLVLLFAAAYGLPLVSRWTVTGMDSDYAQSLTGPSPRHWFGTDQIGHDLFVQTMSGLQKSLLIGLIAALLSTTVAALAGAAAGYFGGWSDRIVTAVVDLLLVLPSFLIVAIISPRLRGGGFLLLALLLAAFNWMITARVVRAMSVALRSREYVQAAEFMGVRPWTVIRRHILPNIASLLIVDATLNVSGTILAEAGLSYFGLGVQAPNVSLGTLIAAGTAGPDLNGAPWLWAFPGLLLVATVLAVNLVGDGLRDALDATSASARS